MTKKILFIVSFPFPWMSVPLLYNVLPKLAKNSEIHVTNRGDFVPSWKHLKFINFGKLNQIHFAIKLNKWLKKNINQYDEIFIYNDYNLVLSTFGIIKNNNKTINYIFESKWFIKIKDLLAPLYISRLNSPYYKNILILDTLLLNYLREKGLKNKNVYLISTGVNRSYFKKTPVPHNNNIVYVGNLGKRRKLKVMIDSLRYVVKEIPSAKLFVVGDGNDRHNLESHSKKLGLEKNILFVGFLEHSKVYDYIKKSSLCFAAYPKDKFDIQLPYKIIEYMASNRPVVTTETKSTRHYFKNEKNITMCDYEPKQIAGHIVRLLKNRKLMSKMASEGYKKSKEFDWDKIERIFGRIINE